MICYENFRAYAGPYLMKTDHIVCIPVHGELRGYIANYSLSFPVYQDMPDDYMIMPSASSTLVMSFDGNGILGALRGGNTRPGIIGTYANRFKAMLLVEFQPFGLFAVTGHHQVEIIDRNFLFNDISCRLNREISVIWEQSVNINQLVEQLDKLFLSYTDYRSVNPALIGSVNHLIRSGGMTSVKELAREFCYSEKHLNRLFSEGVGMNISLFARIVKINQALRLLGESSVTLTQIASICGYTDQAHMIREFHIFCGMSPGAYRQKMSFLYNEPFKL